MGLNDIIVLVRPLAIGTIVSLVISVAGSELLVRSLMAFHTKGIVWGLAAIITTVVCFGLPLTVAGLGIASAFRHGAREQLLVRIIAAYVCMLLCSAGVYYSIAVAADFRQEYQAASFYRAQAKRIARDKIPRYVTDLRGFRGIDDKIWTGVEDRARLSSTRTDQEEIPVPDLVDAAQIPDDQLFKLISGSRQTVFFDCLHLSVITMTTVGYGDITPRTWPAKLATDIQAISSTMLIVVALGMLFGNWHQRSEDGA